MFASLRTLGAARRSTPALRSDATCTVLSLDNPHLLAFVRTHPRTAPVIALANFSDSPQATPATLLGRHGLRRPRVLHATGGDLDVSNEPLVLPQWGHVWITTG